MSRVTDILLCTAIEDGAKTEGENPNADALSAWLVANHNEFCALKRLDGHASGDKKMQADVFGVAVNFCDLEGLLAAFYAIKWDFPEAAQLLVKEEEWDAFRVFSAAEPGGII